MIPISQIDSLDLMKLSRHAYKVQFAKEEAIKAKTNKRIPFREFIKHKYEYYNMIDKIFEGK